MPPKPTHFKGLKRSLPSKVHALKSLDMTNKVFRTGNPVSQTPPWYDVFISVPPAEHSIRNVSPRLRPADVKARKPKHLYRPQKIVYVEDRLRQDFFRDHPWELATPRVMVENDGKDHQRLDWGKGLAQPGIKLTGESVVQRQMWLMQHEKLSKSAAYDISRREFYRLRQQEQVEQRIALEEAKHVGAYFGLSRMEVGMHLEDAEFEKWKLWAKAENLKLEARDSAEIETFGQEEAQEAEEIPEEIETQAQVQPAL